MGNFLSYWRLEHMATMRVDLLPHMLVISTAFGSQDKEAANHLGHTPLFTAAQRGYVRSAQRLFDARADLDGAEANLMGQTPLFTAAHSGCEELVRCLLEAGADKNKSDNEAKLWCKNLPIFF